MVEGKSLQHDVIIERANTLQGKVENAHSSGHFNFGLCIIEGKGHGMRRPQDQPVIVRPVCGRDLEEGIVVPVAIDKDLRERAEREIESQSDHQELQDGAASGWRDGNGFVHAFHR